MEPHDYTGEPLDYTAIFRRRWRLIALITVLTILLAVTLGPRLTGGRSGGGASVFTATSTLLLLGRQDYTLQQLALLVTDGTVPERAAAAVGDSGGASSLRNDVSTSIDTEGGVLTITVEAVEPTRAQRLSAALANELIAYVGAQQQEMSRSSATEIAASMQVLEAQIRAIDERIAADPGNTVLQAQRQGLIGAYAQLFQADQQPSPPGTISLLDSPRPVAKESVLDSSGSLPRRLALGTVLGLLLGVGVALVVDRFDTRLRDRTSVERATGLVVLAELQLVARIRGHTRIAGLLFGRLQRSPATEGFRSLRSALDLLLDTREASRRAGPVVSREHSVGVVVCSAGAPEETTTTAVNLAAAFAEAGRSVILVAAQQDGAKAAEMLRAIPPDRAVALSEVSLNGSVQQALVETDISCLRLFDLQRVSSGREQVAALFAELEALAEVVVVDTPPLLTHAEAMDFLPFADVALLVVRAGRTRALGASRAAERLRLGHVSVAAAVLVGRGRPRRDRQRAPVIETEPGQPRIEERRGVV